MWFWISFILLGLVLYIPLGILIILFIFFPIAGFLNKKNNPAIFNFAMNGGMVVLFIAAILVHGGFFGWYNQAESPFGINVWVDRSVENDFYRREEKNGRFTSLSLIKIIRPTRRIFLKVMVKFISMLRIVQPKISISISHGPSNWMGKNTKEIISRLILIRHFLVQVFP